MKKITLLLLTLLISCFSFAQATDLYYIDYTDAKINKLALDGSGTVTEVLDVASSSGAYTAYSTTNQKVYWTDFDVVGSGNIWRMDLDGSNPEVVVPNLNEPYGIAIDNTNGKIYWGDSDGTVSKADLDGSNLDLGFFSVSGAEWTGISLDVENNKMYLYDYWIENLYSVDMDGSNSQIIVPGVWGYGVFVDTVNDKIYFDDDKTSPKTMKRADLDGNNVEVLYSFSGTDGRVYGIDIDHGANKLYFSSRNTGEIYRSDLDGSNLETVKSGLTSPRGIFLYDATLGIEDNILTGIKIVASNKSIALYNLPQNTNFRVYAITGQSLLNGETRESSYVIDAKTLASGIYIVELENASTKARMQKKIIL